MILASTDKMVEFVAVGSEGSEEALLPSAQAFLEELEAGNYAGLETKLSVLDGETHSSAPPRAFTSGLHWLFGSFE